MKISLLQTDIRWADALANRSHAEQLLLSAPQSDLYILPEMFTTGFATKPEGIAEPSEGDTLLWMKQMAARLDAALCGSVAVCDQAGRYCNRAYFVKPDGQVSRYDKRHLFTYGGEHEHYTRGVEPCRVEWRGHLINICICYDLRFPVWSRNAAAPPYDIQIYVANWPASRRIAWDTLLRARAIENQCYVAAVNRVGDDPSCHYDGGTCLIDARGNTIASATDNSEAVITAHIDIESLHRFRTKFPVLNDAD